jgi:hypothetical protein
MLKSNMICMVHLKKSLNLSFEPQQPFLIDVNYSLATMINKPKSRYY